MIKQIPHPNMAYRAAASLRQAIREGLYSDTGKLPAEPALSAELGVSRGTVREAVSILEQEGLVFRKQGLGTFVLRAMSGLTNNLNTNFGVTDMIVAAGKSPGTLRVRMTDILAEEGVAGALDVPAGSPLIKVERTRTADGKPVAHTTDYLARELLSGYGIDQRSLAAALEGNASLYATLRQGGIVVQHGVAQISAVAADLALGEQLQVPAETLLFKLDQVDYEANGQPILASIELLVAEMFVVQVYRRGPG